MIKIRQECEIKTAGTVSDYATKLLTDVLAAENVLSSDCTIIFTDDDYLSELKKKFFGLNQLTDVIAFRLNDYTEKEVEGEIYISLPRARENATQYSEPYGREVARLIIHGGLHLLGYDDQTDSEQAAMRSLEEKYLEKFGWTELITECEQ
ncbi:MAG: rRNA maturation RNase YbeY [Candidatus Marinimicrobia bacterium]|nr:rRNA maturation RNase YbeY [Candidatus Neomarinimicrobiota bacterium]